MALIPDPDALSIRAHPEGAALALRVSAGAARDAITGARGDRLKVAVRRAPEKGRANRAVLELLAGALGLPRGGLLLLAGESSPDKTVLVAGLDPAALRRRLAALPGRTP